MVLAATGPQAQGDVVLSFTSGTNPVSNVFIGESFIIPAASPAYTNIQISFYSNSSPATAITAAGTAFLLNSPLNGSDGTPNTMNSSAAGYLGQAAASGNVYSFGSGVVLQPNTPYYVFMDGTAMMPLATYADSGPANLAFFYSFSGNASYQELPSSSWNIVINGTPAAVPEPSSFVLASLAAAGLGFAGWRKRKKAQAASQAPTQTS